MDLNKVVLKSDDGGFAGGLMILGLFYMAIVGIPLVAMLFQKINPL